MSDFDGAFWNLFVAGAALLSFMACGLPFAALSRRKTATDPDEKEPGDVRVTFVK